MEETHVDRIILKRTLKRIRIGGCEVKLILRLYTSSSELLVELLRNNRDQQNTRNFHDQASDCRLLNEDSALWTYLPKVYETALKFR